jgi:putative nucleotidyltransferase with HDIG domain
MKIIHHMNAIDKNPNYKEIYNIVKDLFESTEHFYYGPFDETYYSLRVYETCKEIIKELEQEVPVQIILVAAILHDIGKTKTDPSKVFSPTGKTEGAVKEWKKHPKLGVPLAKKILTKMGHSEEFIEKVCYLIENHDLRKDEIKNKSIELQILQDADLIADCGFAGFIRPFLYGSKFSRQIINTIKYLQTEINRVEQDNPLNLEVSKSIAKRKIELEQRLIKEISSDINSDLL